MTSRNGVRPFRFASLGECCTPVENIWPPKQSNIRADVWPSQEEEIPWLIQPDDSGLSIAPENFFIDFENGRMKTAPFQMAYLEKVQFNARTGILFPEEGVVLAESWYGERWFRLAIIHKLYPITEMYISSEGGVESLTYQEETPNEVIPVPCFLLCLNPAMYANNYAHWLLEVLPRFAAMEVFPSLRKLKVLVYPLLTPVQEESLNLFGVSERKREVFTKVALRLEKVFVPTYPAAGGYSRQQLEWLGRTLPNLLGLSQPRLSKRRLYISREDASKRRVTNHEELRRMLEKRGFETIIPGRMTLRQQVEMFGETECVVSPHGAACANLVFCPPGARLLEFLPEKYLHPMYGILAQLRGVRYRRLICPADALTSDMTVDIAAVERILDRDV